MSKLSADEILEALQITEDVLAVYPYGSRVYGTAREDSDHDFIVVLKRGMLEGGAFRQNAISDDSGRIQGVLYSRGGFIDAINNYEIGALECLSLPADQVLFCKWPFKVSNWHQKTMIKKVITKASASRHIADLQAKSGFKDRAKKGMFHALRILHFGQQLKAYQKIVDFSVCNELYVEFQGVEDDNFDTRNYYEVFDLLVKELNK